MAMSMIAIVLGSDACCHTVLLLRSIKERIMMGIKGKDHDGDACYDGLIAMNMVAAALGSNACCHAVLLLRIIVFLSGQAVLGAGYSNPIPPLKLNPFRPQASPGN